MLAGILGILQTAKTGEVYHTNRTFTPVTFNLQGVPPVDLLNQESEKLTDTVRGDPIVIDLNGTYAIEQQMAIALGYDTPEAAWNATINYQGTPSNYPGKIFDNVGWVRGTKSVQSDWGAYLWVLQNRIAFQSSTSVWWRASTNGVPVMITNVIVGSLGNYAPMSNVVDIGPHLDAATNNFPGANQSESREFYVDITNVFYQLSIPDIFITPKYAVTNVGGNNVQYTVTGTNIPNGVTWAINPDGLTSGAVIQASNDWHFAGVTPGNVATNYKIRATSVDNTNFYDEANLTVVGLQSLQYKIGTNLWADIPDPLYVCKDTTVDFKVIKIPTNAMWPSGKPVWGGVASGSGMDSNSFTFSTISTNATDYKIVSAECGNTVTGRVIVVSLEIILTTTNDYGLWWFNGENADNYGESGTLTAQGTIEEEGTFQWDVIAGADKVDLNYGYTDADSITTPINTVTIKSTGASVTSNDVTVKLTYNYTVVVQTNFTVYTPKEEIETSVIHTNWTFEGHTNGYESQHYFEIRDQLNNLLPDKIELNENWTETAQNDYTPANTWTQCVEYVWQGEDMADPFETIDYLRQCWGETNDIPNTQNPQTPPGNVKVYHWTGEHYAGSQINSNGVKVLTKEWQYYQDHGRRE